MSGFVVIHRSLIGHPDFRNDAEAMAFAWMVIKAAWKPARVRYKGRSVSLERGQLCVSQRDMAAALDRDKAWVERLFKRLERQGMVQGRREAAAMLITICNYDKYQDLRGSREAVDEAVDEADVRQTRGTEQRREQLNKKQDSLEPKGSCASSDAQMISDDETGDDESGLKPQHVVERWNEIAPSIGKPKIMKLTPERRELVKARINQNDLDGFLLVFSNIQRSKFLNEWRGCGFDWVMKKGNFQKIMEGNYNE